MTDLGLGTETFLVSVLVSVPVRPKMSGLENSLSRKTSFKGLVFMRPKI